MAFLSLPNEIIIEIVECLDNQRHINSVIRVNRRLYSLLKDSLLRYNIRFRGSSALIWAARNGRLETVRDLLRLRANVNIKAESVLGETALHIAAEKFLTVCTNLMVQVSHIPGHEIRIVSYALWDGGDCLLY